MVFNSRSGTLASHSTQVEDTVTALGKLPHVVSASDPLSQSAPTVSSNGVIGYSTLQFNVQPATLGDSYVNQLDNATAPARSANIQVEYGGGLDQLTRPKANDLRSEAIGFAVAFIVLLLIFGSVIGAILPLLTALISVLAGISILGIFAAFLTFGTASPTLAAMIGIGVGIDYAVFLTTRYRQRIIDGSDPVAAAGFCTTTSGRAVLLAAGTVAVAMLGLYASGIVFVGLLGLAAVFGVVTAAVGAVTLVPALLGLAGRRIDKLKIRKVPVAETGRPGDSWHRYAALIGRVPWLFLAGGIALLCVLAIPLLSIQTGHVSDGADPTSYTDKRAYDLISQGFGPGYNGPFTIVVDTGKNAAADTTLASTVQSALAGTSGVAKATPLSPTPDGVLLTGTVIPATGRVISCAALIMIAVFLSFVTSSQVVIKQLSIGLAASILIDATVVRLLLVPAVMFLFGTASWWIPRWLDRILPHINVEGAPEEAARTLAK